MTWSRKVRAGAATFVTMSYIVVLNPAVLKAAGIPAETSMVATIVRAMFGALLMGANPPFALAPYVGENAFIAYTGVQVLGLRREIALATAFVTGAIWLLLVEARPSFLRYSFTDHRRTVDACIGHKIPLHDFTELIPAFAVVTLTSFTYNVAVGTTAGFVLFPFCTSVSGRGRGN